MTETALVTLPITTPALVAIRKRTVLRAYVDAKKNYFVCKRVVDVLLALLLIVGLLSWLLPVLALLIKCTSRGPVFFLQKRTGRGGRSFTCLKLRTMKHDHTAQQNHGNKQEAITKVGAFLRKSGLDELPQFINVLLGSMSVVGPRPHMLSDCRAFSQVVAGYKFRNLVKPGITGLAQVKGYYGKITSRQCIVKRYEWDAHYVRHAGMWLDMQIIATTAWQCMGYLLMIKERKD